MSDERIEHAWKLLQDAYQAQMERDCDRAREILAQAPAEAVKG